VVGVSDWSFEVALALSDFFLEDVVFVTGDESPACSAFVLIELLAG